MLRDGRHQHSRRDRLPPLSRLVRVLSRSSESRCARCVEPSHDGGVEARGTQRTVAGRGVREKPLGCRSLARAWRASKMPCPSKPYCVYSPICGRSGARPAWMRAGSAFSRLSIVSGLYLVYVFPGKFKRKHLIIFVTADASSARATAPATSAPSRVRPHPVVYLVHTDTPTPHANWKRAAHAHMHGRNL